MEISLLFAESKSISKAEVADALDEPSRPDPSSLVDDIWHEIEVRNTIAGEEYPFLVYPNSLSKKRTWRQVFNYSFMLLLSGHSFIEEIRIRRWKVPSKLFERLTETALGNYVGKAIGIGSPRTDPVPGNFKRCLEYVCGNIKEPLRLDPPTTPDVKDDKVDIVAWKPLDDRIGKIVLLANCASGEDWQGKTTEISEGLWSAYIDSPFRPIRAFAFPYVGLDSMAWRRTSLEGGLILDRLRLLKLAPSHNRLPYRKNLIEWSERMVRKLPWLED